MGSRTRPRWAAGIAGHVTGPVGSRVGIVVVTTVVIGYVIADRFFAYFGFQIGSVPVYPGEIAIVIGLATLTFGLRAPGRWTTGRSWAILFLAWAAFVFLLRLPGQPFIDSVRDFSFVYYAAFAIFGFKLPWERFDTRAFSVIAYVFVAQLCFSMLELVKPFPQSWLGGYAQFFGRPDIEGATLAAGVGFFLLADDRLRMPRVPRVLIILAEIAVALLTASRAVFLCLLLVLGVVLLSKRARAFRLPVLAGLVAGGLILVAFPRAGFDTDRGELRFTTTFVRLGATFGLAPEETSAAGGPRSGHATSGSSSNLSPVVAEATLNWRTHWWAKLLQDSLDRPSWLVLGRGFGPNLATEVHYVGTDPQHPLRAPHDIAIDVLARLGVIGLLLWVGWMLTVAAAGLRAARRPGPQGTLALWMLLYWACIMIVAMLGVILESPFGAAPFFFLTGGLLRLEVLSRTQASVVRAPSG
jgi:O-antigen ligase